MGEQGLSLSQKLALLPASIPDCVLDFLEDFKNAEPLTEKNSVDAVKPEYWSKNQDSIKQSIAHFRTLGEISEVDGETLARQYPGGCMVKLKFSSGEERGIGFIVSQGTGRTGTISIIYFQNDGYDSDTIREALIKHYKTSNKG